MRVGHSADVIGEADSLSDRLSRRVKTQKLGDFFLVRLLVRCHHALTNMRGMKRWGGGVELKLGDLFLVRLLVGCHYALTDERNEKRQRERIQ